MLNIKEAAKNITNILIKSHKEKGEHLIVEIFQKFTVSKGWIYKWLAQYGIKNRRRTSKPLQLKGSFENFKIKLNEFYCNVDLYMQQINDRLANNPKRKA